MRLDTVNLQRRHGEFSIDYTDTFEISRSKNGKFKASGTVYEADTGKIQSEVIDREFTLLEVLDVLDDQRDMVEDDAAAVKGPARKHKRHQVVKRSHKFGL